MLKPLLGTMALVALAMPAAAAVNVTLEAPGAVNTTRTDLNYGVETFDSWAPGVYTSIATDFNGSDWNGTYSGSKIMVSDQWGGADGSNYVVALDKGSIYTLDLDKSANYFGFWLSALSPGNTLAFYDGGNLVQSYDYTSLSAIVAATGLDYKGKPGTGQTPTEDFAFMNFDFTGGDSYNKIVFSQTASGGFESDNHTVGSLVPEPATWAMMIAGFGLVGSLVRRRRSTGVLA